MADAKHQVTENGDVRLSESESGELATQNKKSLRSKPECY
jgi:hypothetical protein